MVCSAWDFPAGQGYEAAACGINEPRFSIHGSKSGARPIGMLCRDLPFSPAVENSETARKYAG